MLDCAPTSTPRVGCAAMSTLGLWLISRPTMSFCWLPPESEPAVTKIDGVRTSYSLTIRSVSALAPAALMSWPLTLGVLGLVAEDAVLPERGLEQQAVAVAVLGDVARRPASRISRVSQSEMSVSPRKTSPEVGSRMPMMTSTSSAWPLPSTPAMPRTSPAWIVREMSSRTGRPETPCEGEVLDPEHDPVGDRRLLRAAARAARSRP